MSNLTAFAKRELEIAGVFNKDSDYGGTLGESIMELVELFSKQGHSGFSAGMVSNIFDKLSRYEPLTPLTGKDDEWTDVSAWCGEGVFQNKRCGHVFKTGKDGQAYDNGGKIFKEPSGITYTSADSRVYIAFPYIPKSEFIDVPANN